MRITIPIAAAVLGCAALALAGARSRDFRGSKLPESSRVVFERRIMPILRAPNPSSCSECHLSGVDLKDYIHPSETETFVSLRDRGLIDLKQPENSRLLKLIRMSSPKSPLVSQKARAAEYEAFRDWITAGAANPELADAVAGPGDKGAGPKVSNAVIRHTRMDNVMKSFIQNVWSQNGRCMDCHRQGSNANNENVKKFGERVAWFVPESPEETIERILRQKLINVDQPEQSLFLLKPLNVVPHGGGVKMLKGDTGYKQFRAWVEDYAKSVKGLYRTEKELPLQQKLAFVYTDAILTITETPDPWGNRSVRVDAYPWDPVKGKWASAPTVTGERQVYAEGHSTNIWMWLIPPAGGEQEISARANPQIPAGKYLFKYYCDTTGKLDKDYTIPTDSPAFYQGSQEVEARWVKGWGSREQVLVRITR